MATNCKCSKCNGSGFIQWSTQDGGVCYKCEGNGYIGKMPIGFVKNESELSRKMHLLLRTGLYQMRDTYKVAELKYSRCEGSEYDAEYLSKRPLQFNYNKFNEMYKNHESFNFSFYFVAEFTETRIIIKKRI